MGLIKKYSKAYWSYSIVSLRNNIVPALESVHWKA